MRQRESPDGLSLCVAYLTYCGIRGCGSEFELDAGLDDVHVVLGNIGGTAHVGV